MLSALIQSRLRYPAVRLAAQLVNRRSVHHGPLVLVTAPLKTPTPTIDRDRTVSRRSEPSSRATLMGEQPNPWDLLQPQDVTSRHRGAKPPRRYELLGLEKVPRVGLASHLDAFSAYPIQTQIPSGAPGGTTGKPEVCPSRSSRTSDGTTQNSHAHDR